jgi:hypothetical protein
MKKIKIRTKKGSVFLESETVKVVLAVICISLLVILAYKLYTLFMKKTAIEQARESLDQLLIKINNLKEGESGKFSITGPNDWYLMLFNKGDPMPSQCSSANNCLCICETQNYIGCDQQGLCKPLNIDGQMSYSCMQASAFDMTNQYKCLRIKITDIPLKKENGILYMGNVQIFVSANGLREVLSAIDTETNKSIDELLAEYVVSKDYNFKVKIERLMISYVEEYVTDIHSWYLTIKTEDDKNLGIFGYYPTYGGDMPEIPSFKHSFEETKKYGDITYLFKWEFNFNKEPV